MDTLDTRHTFDNRFILMKEVFEKIYDIPVLKARIKDDPVEFPHLYQDSRDIELAGFIASSLAFGRIDLFKPVTRKILSFSNGNLYDYVINFNPAIDAKRFDDLYYRMCKGRDIACLIFMLSKVVRKYENLKNMFYSCYDDAANIKEALQKFTDTMRDIDTTPVYGKRIYPRGLLQLVPSPRNGGPCKRLNMYLRWMVRPDDGVDFGLWDKIPPSALVIPVDTHIARICKGMSMTGRKSANWAMAEEITDKFKLLSPEDPLKYDFALCHLGITGKWKEVLLNG